MYGLLCILGRYGLLCILGRYGLLCILGRYGLLCILGSYGLLSVLSIVLQMNDLFRKKLVFYLDERSNNIYLGPSFSSLTIFFSTF